MQKVAIIGGGVAGLTAGIYLQKAGVDTVLFEKHCIAGGNLSAWTREGYTVDNCMHWLNGTRKGSPLNRLFTEIGLLGDTVAIKKLPFFYRSMNRTDAVAFYRSPLRTRREMLTLSPTDRREIDRLYRAVCAAVRLMASPEKKGNGLFGKLTHAPALLPYLRLSLQELSRRFTHPLLRAAFTDYIGGEYTAMALIFAYASFVRGDADLPAGGTKDAAKRVTDRYLSLGGSLHTGCEITEVIKSGRRLLAVTQRDGEECCADAFIFASDPAVVFGKLLSPSHMPKRLVTHYKKRSAYPIFSAFHVAWSVDSDSLPFSGCTAIPAAPFLSGGRIEKRLMLRAFGHEPDFAPAGKSLLQGWVFQRENAAREWISLYKDRDTYLDRKELLSSRMTDAVTTFYPSLKNKLHVIDTWTPATYHRYTGAMYGAFLSFAVTEKILPLTVSPHLKELSNAFLATQWQSPAGGLPGAAGSGKAAAEAALKYLRSR